MRIASTVLALLLSSAGTVMAATEVIKFEEVISGPSTDYFGVISQGGILETLDDTVSGIGDQAVDLTFLGGLFVPGSPEEAAWIALNASAATTTGFISLSGITLSGNPSCLPACTGNGFFFQPLSGGTFELFAADNSTLLLSASLGSGSLSGVLNAPNVDASAGWGISLTDFTITGGTLYGDIINPAAMNISLEDVFSFNPPDVVPGFGGQPNGFAVTQTGALMAFVANGHDGDISASAPHHDTIPEPDSVALLGLGLIGLGFTTTRRRRHT